jgi:hypothetical protein
MIRATEKYRRLLEGGEGSGNFGHAGRKGRVGGSLKKGYFYFPAPKETVDTSSVDFWNEHLEYNALRMKADTNAIAFLAVKLENAGDILRELSKTWSDPGYIGEKVRKLYSELHPLDWIVPLGSDGEDRLAKIRVDIENIPKNADSVTNLAINIIRKVAERNPVEVKKALDAFKRRYKP